MSHDRGKRKNGEGRNSSNHSPGRLDLREDRRGKPGTHQGANRFLPNRKTPETIDWAQARSPFYRKHLAGFSAKDIVSPEDLAKLPFTTADEIGRQPLSFLCVSQSEIDRVVTLQTSGTTGNPKRVFFTSGDHEGTIDFFHHGMATLAGPGDKVLILMPGTLPGSVGDLLAKGLQRLGATGIPHGFVRNASETLAIMEKERVDCLVGLPTQVLRLARSSGGMAAPKAVLLSADNVPEAVSNALRYTWGCEVYTHYGMTEMGFGGGVECDARKGYHLREADLYVEIVEPRTGGPLPEGEPGEVVFTTITRKAMPLIRYRTGDLSRFLPVPCPCGSALKLLEPVRGRVTRSAAWQPAGPSAWQTWTRPSFPLKRCWISVRPWFESVAEIDCVLKSRSRTPKIGIFRPK